MNEQTIRTLGSDVLQAMGQMNEEKYRRLIRTTRPRVVTYTSTAPMDLVPPGCIMAVFARKGGTVLQDLEHAIVRGNTTSINEFAARMREQYSARRMVSMAEAVAVISNEPVFAELRYGGKTLASNLCVPDNLPAAIVTFAYSGGQLADEGFSLVEYPRTGAREELEVLLVRRPPILTDVERRALELVPADQLELNIGNAAYCFAATGVVVAYVAVAIVVVTAVGNCASDYDRLARVSLPADRVHQLGPAGTARELLRLRRELLEEIMQ
jgi:hypothetical protein